MNTNNPIEDEIRSRFEDFEIPEHILKHFKKNKEKYVLFEKSEMKSQSWKLEVERWNMFFSGYRRCYMSMKEKMETKMVNTKSMEEYYKDKCIEWKTLDINCLPEDIFSGNYIFRQGGYSIETVNPFFAQMMNILKCVSDGDVYKYRKTPTKKTNDELAEEYAERNIYKYTTGNNDYIEFHKNEFKRLLKKVFIAGRKSTESVS